MANADSLNDNSDHTHCTALTHTEGQAYRPEDVQHCMAEDQEPMPAGDPDDPTPAHESILQIVGASVLLLVVIPSSALAIPTP
jgi:hypothetical protein